MAYHVTVVSDCLVHVAVYCSQWMDPFVYQYIDLHTALCISSILNSAFFFQFAVWLFFVYIATNVNAVL